MNFYPHMSYYIIGIIAALWKCARLEIARNAARNLSVFMILTSFRFREFESEGKRGRQNLLHGYARSDIHIHFISPQHVHAVN
jgi:hypothetical protein